MTDNDDLTPLVPDEDGTGTSGAPTAPRSRPQDRSRDIPAGTEAVPSLSSPARSPGRVPPEGPS